MERWTARVGTLLLAVSIATALLVGVTFAGHGSSDVVVDDHVETTPRDVNFLGKTYTVSSVGRVSAGDPLSVRVVGPENVTSVHLTERNGSIIDEVGASANESVTFQTGTLTPGQYVVATHDDSGTFLTAYPVVVTGYETSLSTSTPDSQTGNATTFTVDLSRTTDEAPPVGNVTVVVRGEETVTRLNATKTDDGTYTATGTLPPGEYEAYATVRTAGTDGDGAGELVGLSNASTVTVENASGGTTPNATTTQTPNTTTQTPNATTPTTHTTTATTNATGDQPLVPGVDDVPLLSRLTDGVVAKLLPTGFERIPLTVPTILAGTVLVALVLSLVAYQTVFTLRRR